MASTSESDSSVDRRLSGSFARSLPSDTQASQIWLDGDVLSCACPDCDAPMTIRVWLSLAECRMCGAQVELTEEQERVARQLLETREAPKPKAKAADSIPIWADPVERPAPSSKKRSLDILPPPSPRRVPIPPPDKRRQASRPSQPLIAQVVDDRPKLLIARPADALPVPSESVDEQLSTYGRGRLQNLISALVSLLVNMLVIILLGLIEFKMPPREPVLMIEVDASADSGGRVGSEVVVKEPPKKPEPAVKEPTPQAPVEPQASKKPEVLATLPALDTKALTAKIVPAIEPVAPPPISGGSGSGSPVNGTLLASRDLSLRTKVLNIEGGNERTELAVAMGLKWLALHQNRDGSWSLHGFDQAGECRGRCNHTGALSDTAGTALALLPFLGAGYTHRDNHDYRETVQSGLDWLVANQKANGDLRGPGEGRMYAHGQAAIALCEAYALTRDTKLRGPAQRAIDFIVKAQHTRGGWRYAPGEQGDTSIVGWQIMALRSAQMADLSVPALTFVKSDEFLSSVQSSPSQAKFSYMPGHRFTSTMTAEGLLCRLYSGWRSNSSPLLHGVDWLLKDHLPTENDLNMYYVYYATQVLHHVGGPRWTRWNDQMKRVLLATQSKDGHMAGSWKPTEGHDQIGGRLYATALAVCTLEVYYRHMPLYKNATKQPGK